MDDAGLGIERLDGGEQEEGGECGGDAGG